MAEMRPPLTDDDLERALRAAAADIRYPETPPIAAAVRVRLVAEAEHRTRARPRWAGPFTGARLLTQTLLRRRGFLGQRVRLHAPRGDERTGLRVGLRPVLLALVALIVLALVASPDVRLAVADRLGLRGVMLTHVPIAPGAPARPVGQGLDLGRQTTLKQAQASVPFPIRLPADLGGPDAVYMAGAPSVPYVSLVYREGENLPETATTGVGLLLSQFRGSVDQASVVGKALPPGASVEAVAVGGAPGFWISGAPHGFFFQAPDGQMRSDGSRLAGNTLLWERDAVTFRLESALAKEAAIRIAASVR